MNTVFLLMAQFDGAAVIPVEKVCASFFSHLTPQQFIRKTTEGEIDLPVVRIENSQKAARGVYLPHLAAWIDKRVEAAKKENDQLQGRR
ncbi:pyocin activator PrtN family protein [Mesorhizobium sp. M0663]|uniref:pyocin activator PrtN family protein n=1 Tax=unclassified Mesorhizobium TaxID=325217 RepID=UPI0003CF0EEF|nr:pyocin activator PrtN family protein [Mesorhizobium sp. LSHC420B00]ESX70549.1 Pyocin activator protein PrtN [Mesorhizobium sp. LSHC420B00]